MESCYTECTAHWVIWPSLIFTAINTLLAVLAGFFIGHFVGRNSRDE